MIVVVDSNILFSACISPNGKIAEILFSPLPRLERVSCYYALAELFKHQPKIVKCCKLPADKVSQLFYQIIKQVDFVNENIIESKFWSEADRITSGVDGDDVAFVALTLQKKGWLWTGDKPLTQHLTNMGFERVISTAELYVKLGIENQ